MWLFKILVYFPSLLYLETTTLIALKEERSARLAGATCWNIPPKKVKKNQFQQQKEHNRSLQMFLLPNSIPGVFVFHNCEQAYS